MIAPYELDQASSWNRQERALIATRLLPFSGQTIRNRWMLCKCATYYHAHHLVWADWSTQAASLDALLAAIVAYHITVSAQLPRDVLQIDPAVLGVAANLAPFVTAAWRWAHPTFTAEWYTCDPQVGPTSSLILFRHHRTLSVTATSILS